MFEKEIVVDGRAHMFGRLASIVAKEIMNGQKVVIVRAERINISGSLFRNKLKYMEFLNKTRNANPRRGHVHYRSPARMFWRAVRGMLKHKSNRGMEALGRMKIFEGIPYPYDHKKRMVIPGALKTLRLKNHRKHCLLGDLSSQVGWTKQSIVNELEEKRKVKSKKFYVKKVAKIDARKKAGNSASLKKINEELVKLGY
jgi:large subunit ribosomal protein L13Ae